MMQDCVVVVFLKNTEHCGKQGKSRYFNIIIKYVSLLILLLYFHMYSIQTGKLNERSEWDQRCLNK